jgi:hypothetical protein
LDAATAVMTSESCVLTLRYALWHVGANALLVAGLAWAGETHTFFSAHIFGLFALLADFGVFYLHAQLTNALHCDCLWQARARSSCRTRRRVTHWAPPQCASSSCGTITSARS